MGDVITYDSYVTIYCFLTPCYLYGTTLLFTSPAAFLASFSTTYYNQSHGSVLLTNNIFDVFDRESCAVFEALDAQEERGFEDARPLGRTEFL